MLNVASVDVRRRDVEVFYWGQYEPDAYAQGSLRDGQILDPGPVAIARTPGSGGEGRDEVGEVGMVNGVVRRRDMGMFCVNFPQQRTEHKSVGYPRPIEERP